MISLALREQIRLRASDCCEYCQMPQSCTQLPHKVDHIRAQKHIEWNDGVLVSKTKIAAATIGLLRINSDSRVGHRRLLIKCRLFPG